MVFDPVVGLGGGFAHEGVPCAGFSLAVKERLLGLREDELEIGGGDLDGSSVCFRRVVVH